MSVLMIAAVLAGCSKGEVRLLSKRQLPAAVQAQGPVKWMADRGQPYEAGDAIGDESLPTTQFIEACRKGDRIRVHYWRGGIATVEVDDVYVLRRAQWVLLAQR